LVPISTVIAVFEFQLIKYFFIWRCLLHSAGIFEWHHYDAPLAMNI
jgi:hypothetical protein